MSGNIFRPCSMSFNDCNWIMGVLSKYAWNREMRSWLILIYLNFQISELSLLTIWLIFSSIVDWEEEERLSLLLVTNGLFAKICDLRKPRKKKSNWEMWDDDALKSLMLNVQCVMSCMARNAILLKPDVFGVHIIQFRSKPFGNHIARC